MDNYGTHSTPECSAGSNDTNVSFRILSRPVRVGLNLVERWFGELTGKRIRRGAFVSVEDLQKAIADSSPPGTTTAE